MSSVGWQKADVICTEILLVRETVSLPKPSFLANTRDV
jgi:hypothetical protein